LTAIPAAAAAAVFTAVLATVASAEPSFEPAAKPAARLAPKPTALAATFISTEPASLTATEPAAEPATATSLRAAPTSAALKLFEVASAYCVLLSVAVANGGTCDSEKLPLSLAAGGSVLRLGAGVLAIGVEYALSVLATQSLAGGGQLVACAFVRPDSVDSQTISADAPFAFGVRLDGDGDGGERGSCEHELFEPAVVRLAWACAAVGGDASIGLPSRAGGATLDLSAFLDAVNRSLSVPAELAPPPGDYACNVSAYRALDESEARLQLSVRVAASRTPMLTLTHNMSPGGRLPEGARLAVAASVTPGDGSVVSLGWTLQQLRADGGAPSGACEGVAVPAVDVVLVLASAFRRTTVGAPSLLLAPCALPAGGEYALTLSATDSIGGVAVARLVCMDAEARQEGQRGGRRRLSEATGGALSDTVVTIESIASCGLVGHLPGERAAAYETSNVALAVALAQDALTTNTGNCELQLSLLATPSSSAPLGARATLSAAALGAVEVVGELFRRLPAELLAGSSAGGGFANSPVILLTLRRDSLPIANVSAAPGAPPVAVFELPLLLADATAVLVADGSACAYSDETAGVWAGDGPVTAVEDEAHAEPDQAEGAVDVLVALAYKVDGEDISNHQLKRASEQARGGPLGISLRRACRCIQARHTALRAFATGLRLPTGASGEEGAKIPCLGGAEALTSLFLIGAFKLLAAALLYSGIAESGGEWRCISALFLITLIACSIALPASLVMERMFRLRAFLHATTAGALAAERESMLWGLSKAESERASLAQLRVLRQWRTSVELLRVGKWAVKRYEQPTAASMASASADGMQPIADVSRRAVIGSSSKSPSRRVLPLFAPLSSVGRASASSAQEPPPPPHGPIHFLAAAWRRASPKDASGSSIRVASALASALSSELTRATVVEVEESDPLPSRAAHGDFSPRLPPTLKSRSPAPSSCSEPESLPDFDIEADEFSVAPTEPSLDPARPPPLAPARPEPADNPRSTFVAKAAVHLAAAAGDPRSGSEPDSLSDSVLEPQRSKFPPRLL
ncbi:hypothetical protein T492DRAFT_878927, partial [Pavlovales sp. CCMP2436]